MAESKFVTANNLKLHYLDFGNLSAPPLMCVHGLSGNAHNFDAVGLRLSARYHVMSLDVRGRGDSQWGPPDQYEIRYYVSDLKALVDQIQIDSLSLIGTSMGGIISMAFSALNSERIDKLVLNDIGPEVDMRGGQRIAGYFGDAPQEFNSLAEVVAYYREIYPPVRNAPEAAVNEFARWSVKDTGRGTLTWKIDPAVRQTMRTGIPRAAVPDLWEPYAKIKAKLLIVRGAESDILSPSVAARMTEVLPGTKIAEVPGVGHAPSLSEPAAVKALDEFLGLKG